ncbi:autotransporter adhesin [Herbaspirillum sp. SJZ099]|nr:autotransporter adhesin [Herbaspirillum sp. SJZ099]
MGEVSVGSAGNERTITNVAAGINGTDAVNVNQLSAVNSKFTALQQDALLWDPAANGGAGAFSANHLGAGPNKITNVAPGAVNSTSTDAINGSQLFAVAGDISNTYITNNGSGIKYVRTNDTAGAGLTADDAHASALGSTAVGYNAAASAADALALGRDTVANQANSVALGANAKTTVGAQSNYTAYAMTPLQNSVGEVSVGSAGAERKLTNVAAGSADTDAVNVAQLKAADAKLVAVQQDALLWDPAANGGAGAFSANHLGAGPNKITNVAVGAVNATSTDAINGSQLFALAGDISNTYITNNGSGIKYVRTNDTAGAGLPADDAHASALGSTAVGYNATASAANALALGRDTVANQANSVALGANATTAVGAQTNYAAFALTAPQNSVGEVSVGSAGNERTITHVAAGISGTDAVNVNQLAAVNARITSGTVGPFVSDSSVTTTQPVSSGANASAGGFGASATGAASTVIGNQATDNAVANSTVLGQGASIAAGLSGSNVALGQGSKVAAAAVPTASAVISGTTYNFAGASPAGVVSVGAAGAEQQITNVAAGQLSSSSTDAVNGSQLFATNTAINNLNTGKAGPFVSDGSVTSIQPVSSGANALAGGFAASATGAASAVLGNAATDNGVANSTVLGQGASIGAGMTGSNVALGQGSKVAAAAVPTGSVVLSGTTYNFAGASPAGVVSVGAGGAERQITNVAAGQLSATSTDAVNGSQLFATNTALNSINNGAGVKYFHANSILADSQATGLDSTAMGPNAIAAGVAAIAAGRNAQAQTDGAIAIGDGAIAKGGKAISIGVGNTANGDGAVAIGDPNVVSGTGAVGLGANNTVTGTGAVGVGNANTANGEGALAIGNTNTASGIGAAALGSNNNATGDGSLAIGINNNASGTGSLALGNNVVTSGNDTLALGTNAKATAQSATAVGNNAVASGTISTAIGNSALASAANSTAVGEGAQATNVSTSAFGNAAVAGGLYSTAIGRGANTSGQYATALGFASEASGSGGVALGIGALANQDQSVALGSLSSATRGANTGYTAFGLSSAQTSIGEVAVGRYLFTDPDNGTVYTQGERQITGVAAGSAPTDAVNVSQLTGAAANLGNSISNVFGGATSYNPATGQVTGGFTYAGNSSYTSVQQVFDALTTTGTKYFHANSILGDSTPTGTDSVAVGPLATASAANSVAMGNGANASVAGGVALGSGSVSDRAVAATQGKVAGSPVSYDTTDGTLLGAVSLGNGTSGSYRQITNVADATQANDAVTLRQLVGALSSFSVSGQLYFHAQSPVAGGADDSVASGTYSVAVGASTVAAGNDSIGIGHGATIQGTATSGIAIGQAATVLSAEGIALGNNANAGGIKSLALGSNAKASLQGGIAMGADANASGVQAIAMGAGAVADKDNSIALGSGSATTVGALTNYTAYALAAPQTSAGEINIGNRQITGLAAGVADTDAVNVSQLKAVAATVSDALLWDPALGAFSAAHGASPTNKITNVADGTLSATSTDAVNGSQLFATNTNVTNLGNVINNIAGNTSATYITNNGSGVKYVRTNDTGLTADDAHASAKGATAVGYNAQASFENAVAIGNTAVASVFGGVALGSGSVSDRVIAATNGTMPVGSTGIPYNTGDKILLGAISVGDSAAGTYRQITNVADGTQAQDAVTVRQLTGALTSFATSTTKYFHANSTESDSLAVGINSVAVGPNTVVNGDNGIGIGNGAVVDIAAVGGMAIGQNAKSLQADAMAMGNGAIASGAQSIAQGANAKAAGGSSIAIGSGANAAHADSIALGSGSTTTVGAQVGYVAYALAAAQTSAGEVNIGNRKITGVAAGSADTDAVNVSQLKAVAAGITNGPGNVTNLGDINTAVTQSKQYTDSQISNLRGDLDKYRNDANGGTASAMAVAGLPQPGAPGKSMVAIAGSTYEGQTGLALGLSTYTDNGRWIIKAAATTNSRGKTGAVVGAGFQW